jgi:AraC-like DNA-binding protein
LGSPLAHIRLEATDPHPKKRWLFWQETMAPFFEVATESLDEFYGRADFYNLGAIVCGANRCAYQRYARSRRKIASTGLDQYLVQYCYDGGSRGVAGGQEMLVRPGDIGIIDLSQVCESIDEAGRVFTMVVPQSLLNEAARGRTDLHGLTIAGDSPSGKLLADYLRALEEWLPRGDQSEAAEVVDATLSLLSSALCAVLGMRASNTRRLEELTGIRIRRHILRNLCSPDLTPASVAHHFELSRTQLYRYFEPDGGVAAFIRRARLRSCLARLTDPSRRVSSIRELAEEHGFSCEAHFSRLFRRTFGVSPTEARRAGHVASRSRLDDVGELIGWTRSLA